MSLAYFMPIEVQTQKSSDRPSSPLFHVLASQIHHIIRTMEINASEVLTAIKPDEPLPYDRLYFWHNSNYLRWWSTDPEGQIPISTAVVEGASGFNCYICTWSYEIPQQIYPILWDIHKACGFDPESTEMAEYLGYPLLEPKIDSDSVSVRFGPSQEVDQPSHIGYESEVELDDGSSSSHDTFVSALPED
ncbi:hypothetical protein C8J56DRAFT_1072715 [Mycena floridula]|nr:hypothetical protein C8J56DRAFT_1072715 [Mycena floridula]